jgi:hypothetical protein
VLASAVGISVIQAVLEPLERGNLKTPRRMENFNFFIKNEMLHGFPL